ncbi:hypothetical protein EJB05_18303, partial [Eragrostis curvula]
LEISSVRFRSGTSTWGTPEFTANRCIGASASPLFPPPPSSPSASPSRRRSPTSSSTPGTTSPSFPAPLRCGSEAPCALWWPQRLHRVVFHPGQRRGHLRGAGKGACEGAVLQLEVARPPPATLLCAVQQDLFVASDLASSSFVFVNYQRILFPCQHPPILVLDARWQAALQTKQHSHGRRGWLEDLDVDIYMGKVNLFSVGNFFQSNVLHGWVPPVDDSKMGPSFKEECMPMETQNPSEKKPQDILGLLPFFFYHCYMKLLKGRWHISVMIRLSIYSNLRRFSGYKKLLKGRGQSRVMAVKGIGQMVLVS